MMQNKGNNPSSSFVFLRLPWLSLTLRIVVGGVLIYSGASKAIGPSAEFAATIAAYQLLPAGWASTVALIWPWIELLVGTYLFFGFFTRPLFQAASGLFVIFLAIVTSAMLRGIDPVSCGCFGMGVSLNLRQTAVLDVLLLTLSILGAVFTPHVPRFSVDEWIDK